MHTEPETPLVSIVTPSLNQGRFLEQAIASIEAQDHPAIEHIVIDGGSADETRDVLARHPRIRWISEPDGGQSDALNKGFAMARGDIFGWLNADDYYLAGAVSAAVETLARTGAGLVYGGYLKIEEGTDWTREVPAEPFDLIHQVEVGNRVSQPSAFFTRDAFAAAGGLDLDLHYAMDYDLWVRIGQRFPVAHVEGIWAVFRYHEESKSVAELGRFWREERRVARRHGGSFLSPMLVGRLEARRPRTARLVAAAMWARDGVRRSGRGSGH